MKLSKEHNIMVFLVQENIPPLATSSGPICSHGLKSTIHIAHSESCHALHSLLDDSSLNRVISLTTGSENWPECEDISHLVWANSLQRVDNLIDCVCRFDVILR